MTGLPQGWRVAPLASVAEVTMGQSPPGSSYNEAGAGLPLFQGKAEFTELHPVVRKYTTAGRKMARAGDILLSVRAPVGPTNVAHVDCVIGRGLAAIRARPGLDQRYLLWAVRANATVLAAKATGSTFGAVSGSQVRAHLIPVAPRIEQRRIVEILEDHLSRLDAADVGIEGAVQRAANLRIATIASALESVEGESLSVEELSLSIRNGIFVSRAQAAGTGVRIMRIGAVRPLALDLNDLRYSERAEEDLQREGSLVSPGNLLFTRYNGNPKFVGACAVVPTLSEPLTYPDKLIRVVVNEDVAHPDFVAFACTTSQGRRQIQNSVKTTAGQAGISGRDLRQVVIRLPELAVQQRVVEEVKQRLDSTGQGTRALEVAQLRSEMLRRTLLTAAFSGRLTR